MTTIDRNARLADSETTASRRMSPLFFAGAALSIALAAAAALIVIIA